MSRSKAVAALALTLAAPALAHARGGSDDSGGHTVTIPAAACIEIAADPADGGRTTLGGAIALQGRPGGVSSVALRCPLALDRGGSSGDDRLAGLEVHYLDGDGPGADARVGVSLVRTALAPAAADGFAETVVCSWSSASSGAVAPARATIPCASPATDAFYHVDVLLTVQPGPQRAAFVGLRAVR